MHALNPSVAAMAVATIFAIWQRYSQVLIRKHTLLRERVAYMLWVAACRIE